MGDNSFLRDFKARMLSSRRAISRSMMVRNTSNGSQAEHEVLVSSGEKTIGFLIWIFITKLNRKKKAYLQPCDLLNTEEARASARSTHFKPSGKIKLGKINEALEGALLCRSVQDKLSL